MKSRAVVLQVVVITVFAAPFLCVCVLGAWLQSSGFGKVGYMYVYIALETKEEEEEEDDDDGDNDDYI
jgi:hypothetical protein